MKPYVVCHMISSLDGKTLPSRWSPSTPHDDLYERLHSTLEGQVWLVGRVTGAEFAKRQAYPVSSQETFPRRAWLPAAKAGTYAVVLDPEGKIAWGRSDIGGDPIIVVLTEQVPDSHLAGLRADGVFYIFAGQETLDLRLALETLQTHLDVARLLLEGGGTINGAFLRAGLIDEISLIVWPAIDGRPGAPAVFDAKSEDLISQASIDNLELLSCQPQASGGVWLRYRVRQGAGAA